MNVSSSTTSISIIQSTTSVQGADGNGAPKEACAPDQADPPATATISGRGRLFQQLKQLHDSDPARFKQVMAGMADSLRADAKNAQGDDAKRLSALADRLDKVAQSGDLADIAPSQHAGGAHGHHGHHHHQGGSAVGGDLESAFSAALASTNTPGAPVATGAPGV